MGHWKMSLGRGRWIPLLALLWAAATACSMRETPRNMPPTPADVRLAKADVEAAFAQLPGDPVAFRKIARKALPPLREALQKWSMEAEGVEVRNTLRSWSIEAGMVETAVTALPDRPSDADCRPIREAWDRLRAKLP